MRGGYALEGLEAARAELERVLRAASDGAQAGLELVGQQVVNETQARAPVLTGTLRRSYTHETGPRYVEVGTNLEYAPAQEFGSRYQGGTPHLRPALDATRARIPALIAEGASRAMGGAGGLGSTMGALRGGL